MAKTIVTLLSTLGVGLIPKAPGTWGSLLAALFWWALMPLSLLWQGVLIISAFSVGWVGIHYYERWGHSHDPKEIVVDELVGMWITLLMVPKTPTFFVIGFLLFRLFDIWKPQPIGWIDRRVPGALGTILDDVVAGIFAAITLQVGWWCYQYFLTH